MSGSRNVIGRLLSVVCVGAGLLISSSAAASEITPTNIVTVMNVYRQRHHLGPLLEDRRLDAAAEDRMNDMEELGYWAHISPAGMQPFHFIKERGYSYSRAGENLARGFETAEVLVESWMESPGHRDNILSAGFSNVGIAIIDGSTMGRAAGKSVVLLFGREMVIPIRETSDR